MAALYGLADPYKNHFPYPLNIWSTFSIARTALAQRDEPLQLFITQLDELPAVCTAKRLDTSYHLYYVPLSVLSGLLMTSGKGELSELLLSAFSYLHHAGICLCDGNSFIGYEMQALQDYTEECREEWNEVEHADLTEEIIQITARRTMLNKKIAHKVHLRKFGKRMRAITAENPHETQLVAAIQKLYQLYQEFPNERFDRQLHPKLFYSDEEDRVQVEQYLSFYWGGNTWFDEQVMNSIDGYLQELMAIDEPAAVQVFDKPQESETHDLRFETQFLQAIIQLNTALYAL